MRVLLLISSLLLVSSFNAFSQKLVLDYYDKDGAETNKENSFYFELGKKTSRFSQNPKKNKNTSLNALDFSYHFIDTVLTYYTRDSTLRSWVIYDEQGFKNGTYQEYFPNGKVKNKANYVLGHLSGINTFWYNSGKLRSQLDYTPLKKGEVRDKEFLYHIVNYWSADGVRIINAGNGTCECNLTDDEHGLLEKGKVIDGVRDSIWLGFVNDTTLLFKEIYELGKLSKGIKYRDGNEFTYTALEEPPTYAGGMAAMAKFLQKTMYYPPEARRRNIQAKVFTSFAIDKNGEVSDVNLVGAEIPYLSPEALRVVKLMPKWNPGKQRGEPTRVRYIVPVAFKLE